MRRRVRFVAIWLLLLVATVTASLLGNVLADQLPALGAGWLSVLWVLFLVASGVLAYFALRAPAEPTPSAASGTGQVITSIGDYTGGDKITTDASRRDDHSTHVTAGGDVVVGPGAVLDRSTTYHQYFEAAAPRALGSAPPPPALFVGRDQALGVLKARLGILSPDEAPASPVQVVTSVHGWPGVGKTTLAAALAHDPAVAAALPDGVLWVALGPHPDVMSGLANWGRALGEDLAPYPTPEARSERLAHFLRDQRRLLIVDDVWPDEYGQPTAVRPFCVGGTGCRTLVTTRHADLARTLAGRADAVYRLGVLDDAAARKLLVELAGPAVDTSALADLIRALDGLPLALTVAGRLLAAEAGMGWGLDDLLGELRRHKRILAEPTGETRPGLPRDVPLTVAAVLQLSTDQLPVEARGRFALLGAFAPKPATWDAAAAAAVWGSMSEELFVDSDVPAEFLQETLSLFRQVGLTDLLSPTVVPLAHGEAKEVLRLLTNRGLVEPTGEGRFHLHVLLTEHARALAGADLETATHRHACHYLVLARTADKGRQYLSLDQDWPQVRAALGFAYGGLTFPPPKSRERAELLSDLVSVVREYMDVRGLDYEAVTWLERAAIACHALGERHDEGAHLGNLGIAYDELGETRRAIEYYKQAQAIAHEIRDRYGEGNALNNLGAAYVDLGEARRAIGCYRQTLAIAHEIQDEREEANVLVSLGTTYAALGETRRAINHYKQALTIDRKIEDKHGESTTLGNLGDAYHGLGKTCRAIEYYEQALAIAREIGDRRNENTQLRNLGNAYYSLGQVAQAIEYLEQALAIAREIGDRRRESNALGSLGLTYDALGEASRAVEYCEQALTIAREIRDRRMETLTCWNLGLLYERQGDRKRAAELMQVCVDYERDIGHSDAEMHAARVARVRAGAGKGWRAPGGLLDRCWHWRQR